MQSSAITQAAHARESAPAAKPHSRTAVRALYAFDDCTPACFVRICSLLLRRGYSGDSAAYVMPRSRRFYLSVEEQPLSADLPYPPTGILAEYGTRIAAASMLCCLDEHARCLCEHDAVARIAALAI